MRLALVVLAGCSLPADRAADDLVGTGANAPTPADGSGAPGVAPPGLPADTDPGWWATVSATLAADARAFRPVNGGFHAGARGLSARLDADGLVASTDGGEPLGLHFAAWGRADALDRVGAAAPAVGGCAIGDAGTGEACVRRVERDFGDITEWWVSRSNGIEQGWELADAPDGEGPLTFVVEVDGATASAEHGEITLVDAGGASWTYGSLAAWDANGDPLPMAADVDEQGAIVLTVDDTGAAYPITVDPVLTTATTTLYGTGSASDPEFATDLAVFDVNGDGYDDLAVGAPGYGSRTDENFYVGAVYVFHGSATGLSTIWATRSDGTGTDGDLGAQIADAGDIDGDGYDDLLVSAYALGASQPTVYVFHGSSTGMEPTYTTKVFDGAVYLAFAGGGDVNGDGYDDVLVSDVMAGTAWVHHGAPTGLSTTPATTIDGPYGQGNVLAILGDLNGDGYDDVARGASSSRSVYVHLGSATGVVTTIAATVSALMYDPMSAPTPVGGDFNHDGYADLAVADDPSYSTATARVRVYHGGATGLVTTAASTIDGVRSTQFGEYLGSGDTNGDDYDDLVVSASTGSQVYRGSAGGVSTTATASFAPNYGPTDVGDFDADGDDDVAVAYADNAHVYAGAPGGIATTATLALEGDEETTLGYRVARAGDLNGDGYDDLAVTDWEAHEVHVYGGSAAGVSTTPTTTLTSPTASVYWGSTLSAAGDVNGDGYDDLLVTDLDTGSSLTIGRVYVFHGSATGLPTTATKTFVGATSDWYGYATVGLGDVNGDGYGDVAIGAPGYGSGYSLGKVDVHHGGPTGLSTTAARTLSGTAWWESFGTAVDAAGDVNADGYDDLVIGASGYSGWKGAVHVYQGSASGIPATPTTTIVGAAADDYLGIAVSGAGDTNGDGYDDIVIAAPFTGAYEGTLYLHRGSAAGISATAASTVNGTTDQSLGRVLDGIGDVDGDGYGDIAARQSVTSDADTVNVYSLGPTGFATDREVALALGGRVTFFGETLSGAGDVNGDGLADLAVGDSAGAPGGRVYVFHGYADADGDGFPRGEDCDDTDPDAYPGAIEVCDDADADEDCDGLADSADPDATGLGAWYADVDADGYGDAASTTTACDAPPIHVADATDCDDARADVNPGGVEVCDAADTDEDCDGRVDAADDSVSAERMPVFYADTDGDGFGNPTVSVAACDAPAGYVADGADCDDSNAAIRPDAAEVCDDGNVDEDCDGLADDLDGGATAMRDWYADVDGDGFGAAGATVSACDLPFGFVDDASDCDDAAAAIHPGGVEVCDAANVDEDCDGLVDDADTVDPSSRSTFYVDGDGDGFGDDTIAACDPSSGVVTAAGDCDDGDAARNPGAVEADCDDLTDYNCDGSIGSDDRDADGFRACEDCDDADPLASPDGTEVCDPDGADEDCDGLVNDADPDVAPLSWYTDADADGYGTGAAVVSCDAPAGTVTANGDCDDANPAFHPYAEESDCEDPNDYNCDGSAGNEDADGDGYAACLDCDDGEALANPGAVEVCDPDDLDEDCDALADNADTPDPDSLGVWYADTDGDGFGDLASPRAACDAPDGYVPDATDCDDADAAVYPGGTEIEADGVDQDCDGADLAGEPDGDDTGVTIDGPGCGGCSSGAATPGGFVALALLGLASRRRRIPAG